MIVIWCVLYIDLTYHVHHKSSSSSSSSSHYSYRSSSSISMPLLNQPKESPPNMVAARVPINESMRL